MPGLTVSPNPSVGSFPGSIGSLVREPSAASVVGVSEAGTALLTLRSLSKSFGGVSALKDVDLFVRPGEIRAIIGPNGAGKSTLINLISGLYRPDAGTVSFEGHRRGSPKARDLARLGVQRTFQNLALFEGLSVRDNIAMGRTASRHATALERVIGLGRVRRERAETRERVEATAAFLDLASDLHRSIGELPYGVRKRVELARALAGAAPRTSSRSLATSARRAKGSA